MVFAAFPLAPYLHSPEDITFFLYILARVGGLLLIAPLISNALAGQSVKVALAVFMAVIMAMVLYPHYRGDTPTVVLPELTEGGRTSLTLLALTIGKELAIGWVIGMTFTIVFEALLLGGQQVGIMIGFSISEMLDPVSGTSQPLIGQFYTIVATILFLIMDLHHLFFRVLADSFLIIPLGTYHLPFNMLHDLTGGTTMLFHYGMRFAAIPFVVLFLVTIGLGFMARVMPEMNIFMVGFPLRILIGYYALIATIRFFPILLRQVVTAYYHLAIRIVSYIGLGELPI